MKPKKIVIAKHGGGELANQLWNFISIYAYALEKKREIKNPSFFEYHHAFNFEAKEGICAKTLSKLFISYRGRRGPWKKFWRRVYSLYPLALRMVCRKSVVSSENTENKVYYLTPTETPDELKEKESRDTLYFFGWLFRNPEGLRKYRSEIASVFAPKDSIRLKAEALVVPLRKRSKHVIGVHIRRGDYKNFKGGRFWITDRRMKEVVEEYMKEKKLPKDETALLIVSDGQIEKEVWNGLNVSISSEDAFTDLFALSMTDAVLGSNSSFGHFTSWYENIPHIVATNEPIDWEHYRDRNVYFANKHASLVQF